MFSCYVRISFLPVNFVATTFLKSFSQETVKFTRCFSYMKNSLPRSSVEPSSLGARNVYLSRFKSIRGCASSSKNATNVALLKKRPQKRKYAPDIDPQNLEEGRFPVVALATAHEYNLENLKNALIEQNLYTPQRILDQEISDAVLTSANYRVGSEPRHIFFFREGSVVLWNCSELEVSNVLAFLRNYEEEHYSDQIVNKEREYMSYKYQIPGKKCQLQSSTFMLSPDSENIVEKYTFSDAMAQSVKLGVWEATLDQYADSLEGVAHDLHRGKPLKMTRAEVLRKTGALYALRHHINLDSDLLDTPDFYWEQAELERLYIETVGYFSITRRTRVLNEKLSHCAELIELVASQLSDRHHVRLEWMIIILIMVEVGFETLHFLERYWITPTDEDITINSH